MHKAPDDVASDEHVCDSCAFNLAKDAGYVTLLSTNSVEMCRGYRVLGMMGVQTGCPLAKPITLFDHSNLWLSTNWYRMKLDTRIYRKRKGIDFGGSKNELDINIQHGHGPSSIPIAPVERFFGLDGGGEVAYPNLPKFAMVEDDSCHATGFDCRGHDGRLAAFLRKFVERHGNNAVIFIWGDHGPRYHKYRANYTTGLKAFQYVPSITVLVPKTFLKRHRRVAAALRSFQDRLVTHIDLYASMRHIFTGNTTHIPPRSRSLFQAPPPRDDGRSTRSCFEAGVPLNNCVQDCANKEDLLRELKLAW
jgi:hypothetical protein